MGGMEASQAMTLLQSYDLLLVIAGLAVLANSQNTKRSELGFSALLGSAETEVRFERTTLS
jgi:hypothetical protein